MGVVTAMEFVAGVIFLLAFHTYLGYPLLLALARKILPHAVDESHRPRVTLLVAAYNEIAVIEAKARNSIALRYPEGLLDIVFVSDGSVDGTVEALKAFESPRFRVVDKRPRAGKASALKMGVGLATGEILLLSDANTMIASDALEKLVRHFADPAVGAVTGDVSIEKAEGGFGESEGLYYRIEKFIQRRESELGSVIGVDGALYAIRRELFHLPDDQVVLDDFVASMNVVNAGRRVLVDPEARATENATPTIMQEMRRKSRVVAGGFQALVRYGVMPSARRTAALFQFLSHKFLRWVLPLLLVIFLALNVALVVVGARGGAYALLLAAQVVFYALAVAGWVKEKEWSSPVVSVPFYFSMVNAAGFHGLVKFVAGTQTALWKKADRK